MIAGVFRNILIWHIKDMIQIRHIVGTTVQLVSDIFDQVENDD